MNHRAGAHRARLNCNKQLAIFQTMVTEGDTGFAQRNDLGMCRGIAISNVAVPSPADNLSIVHDDCADRNFSGLECALGTAQSFLHPEFVGGSITLATWAADSPDKHSLGCSHAQISARILPISPRRKTGETQVVLFP
jgi:hypothetical protein